MTLTAAVSLGASASAADIDKPFDIGLTHAKAKPYNFTGRVFSFDDAFTAIGSATLVRRHTALTAGHVVFQAGAGFLARATFTRGLYQTYSLQKQQVVSVNSLSGYSTSAAAVGENSFDSFLFDLGYLVLTSPPVDEDWAIYTTDTTALTDLAPQSAEFGRFVLGYPGVTFDGRTMAYIVPTTPYVEVGAAGSGAFENDEYIAEPGMSGGPVYVFKDGVQQVAGETVGGIDDSSGEFNASFIHATNKTAAQFLAGAEYSAGLIKKVKIKGPKTAAKGTTQTYTATIKFTVAETGGGVATTDRYNEIKLRSDTVGTPTNPAVTVKKVSNTQFQVTFSPTLRSRSLITLSADYAPNAAVPNSSLVIQVQ